MKNKRIIFYLLIGAAIILVSVISLQFIPSKDVALQPDEGVKTESRDTSNEEPEPVSGDDETEIVHEIDHEENSDDAKETESNKDEPVVSDSNDTENSGSGKIVTESTSNRTDNNDPVVTVPENVLSDREAHQVAVEKYNELASILFHNISQTNYDEPVIPYDSFKDEVLGNVTTNYELTVKEIYDNSCRNCDSFAYIHNISAGLNLNVYENTEEAISLSVHSAATDLTPAVTMDIKLVKIDDTWKINDLSSE